MSDRDKLIAIQAFVDQLHAEAEAATKLSDKLAEAYPDRAVYWKGSANGLTMAAHLLDELL